jgi:hypothetical protein
MLCINLTSIRDNKPIILNNKLAAHRLYVGSSDVPSFPNRLVFSVTADELARLSAQLQELEVDWLTEELAALERGPVFMVIPFALRVQEEAFTSFRERSSAVTDSQLNLNLGQPTIFIRGSQFPIICTACERQEELKGRRCPDYVEDNYGCFKTSRFALDAMDTFYLTEKGELVYNATSISAPPEQQVESDASTAAIVS